MRKTPEEIQEDIIMALKMGDKTAKQLASKLGYPTVSALGAQNISKLKKMGRILNYVKNGITIYTLPTVDLKYNQNIYFDNKHKFWDIAKQLGDYKLSNKKIKPISYYLYMAKISNIVEKLGGDFNIDEITIDIINNLPYKEIHKKRNKDVIIEVLKYAQERNICIHQSIIDYLNNKIKPSKPPKLSKPPKPSKSPKPSKPKKNKPKIKKWWQFWK